MTDFLKEVGTTEVARDSLNMEVLSNEVLNMEVLSNCRLRSLPGERSQL